MIRSVVVKPIFVLSFNRPPYAFGGYGVGIVLHFDEDKSAAANVFLICSNTA